jgi:nucleoid-associated protein YgaU
MTTMPLGKKIVLVAGALGISLLAASLFRRDTSPARGGGSVAAEPQFVEPVTRRLMSDSAIRPPRAHTPYQLAPQLEPAFSSPLAATGAGSRELTSLPASYPRELSPVGALLRPTEAADPSAGDPPADQRGDAGGALELFPATGPPDAGAAARTHKVSDGDTLSKLAVTYLGSSERYVEIYALNRDILTNPDLLPIGKTLKIPAAAVPAAAAAPKLVPIPPGALR